MPGRGRDADKKPGAANSPGASKERHMPLVKDCLSRAEAGKVRST